jgi:hypothetical protein
VYALHDAVDRPALLPDGSPARTSVTTEYADGIDQAYDEVIAERGNQTSIEGSRIEGARPDGPRGLGLGLGTGDGEITSGRSNR